MSIGGAGLFTHGVSPDRYRLPHPRLGLPVLLVVRQVVLRAFERLVAGGFSLASEAEDVVTTELRKVIENDLRQSGEVPGFNRRLFETVVRQAQVETHDLSSLRKEPDLCFRLRDDEREPGVILSTHYALFVECKPIDRTHPAGSCYCDDGLRRFVDGYYAWAMEEGLMIGYARHGRTIEGHLLPAMREQKRHESLRIVDLPCPVGNTSTEPDSRAEPLHVSRHRRGFPWPDGKGDATEIRVYHSWHCCD